MSYLVIAATVTEIAPFLDYFRKSDDPFEKSIVEVLITGVGLTATTFSLTKQIHTRRPGIVIQAGIGGCFDRDVPLGSVFAIKQDTIADQSVMESGKLKTVFDLSLVSPNKHPYKNGWLINRNNLFKELKLKKARAITINEITTGRQKIELYRQAFNPLIESMEGAALHYVCLNENIPFIQLRSVSNYIGERNKSRWKMKEAVVNLNHELIKLLNTL